MLTKQQWSNLLAVVLTFSLLRGVFFFLRICPRMLSAHFKLVTCPSMGQRKKNCSRSSVTVDVSKYCEGLGSSMQIPTLLFSSKGLHSWGDDRGGAEGRRRDGGGAQSDGGGAGQHTSAGRARHLLRRYEGASVKCGGKDAGWRAAKEGKRLEERRDGLGQGRMGEGRLGERREEERQADGGEADPGVG